MEKFGGRSHFEADRQKRNLYEIGIALSSTKRADYDDKEFSTILVFNYLFKPLGKPLETMLYSFAELDDFLYYDLYDLYEFFAQRFPKHKRRLKKPIAVAAK